MHQIIALYIRPSLACNTSPDEQEALGRAAALTLNGVEVRIYREAPLTPRARRDGLPARFALIRDAGSKFNLLVVYEVGRLGRNLGDLTDALAQLAQRGVIVHEAARAGEVPGWAALSAAQASYRYEAVAEGRARARAAGVRFGRPRLPPERVQRARQALADGMGVRAAARAAGIGVASVTRLRDAIGMPHHP